MNAERLDAVLVRIKVHLERDQYEPCYEILKEQEEEFQKETLLDQNRRDELGCIANLPIEQRWVNILEKAGYIYISELDGVDIRKLNVKQLGPTGKNAIYRAVNKVRERIEEIDKAIELASLGLPKT